MPASNAELEQYRDPDEGLDQWLVKKAFLEKNWDAFPEERRRKLITLMHCFHNMHVWGCSYPPKVMNEVKTLSEGLMTSKPKAPRKPAIAKINFVPATPVTNQFSALDEEVESEVLPEDEPIETTDLEEAPREKRKQRKKKDKRKSAAKTPEPEAVEEIADEVDEAEAAPRCGFGFKSSTASTIAHSLEATSNFKFGMKDDYAKRLGFVRSSETNQGFLFGKPIPMSQDPAAENGLFQFGVDNKATKRTSSEIFTFGKARKERLKSSEELQLRFENASLQEASCKPKVKVCDPEPSNATEYSEVLAGLETMRARLRQVRPSLAQSRIEFAILQVYLEAKGKVQTVKNGEKTCLSYEGVIIASGSSEPDAYEDLRRKILSPEPWKVSGRRSEAVLELGGPRTTPTHAIKRPSTVSPDAIPAPKPPRHQAINGMNDGAVASRGGPITAVPQSNNFDVNPKSAQERPLTVNAQSMILQNLEAVRRTISNSSNFKNKIDMLGGFDKDPLSALNIAFQIAALKPVREAEVASAGCRFHFSTEGNKQTCTIKVHGVTCCDATANANREAKRSAALLLLNALRTGGGLRIVFKNGENRLESNSISRLSSPSMNSQPNALPATTPKTAASKNSKANGLFLVRLADNDQDITSMLNRSSHANDLVPPIYTYSMEGVDHVCNLKLGGKQNFEFEGRAKTKPQSRDEAVRAALNALIEVCPTILVSSMAHDAQEFVKDTMPLGAASSSVTEGLNRKIAQDNVGFQLLEKMGWTGGGLGGGGGLIEPIMLKDNSGNRGLGYAGKAEEPGKRFIANIHGTLRAFLRESDVFQELKFSPTFTNVERKHIHTVARRLGLKSKSSDRPEGRVLCISHNIDWRMILDSLMRQGGSLGKFKLLPPGSWSLPAKTRRGH